MPCRIFNQARCAAGGISDDEPSTRDKVSAINESERRLPPTFAIEALAFDLV